MDHSDLVSAFAVDLRTFLASHRSGSHHSGLYQPASALVGRTTALPDLSLLGGTLANDPVTLSGSDNQLSHGDELDALDFLVAFFRLQKRYSSLVAPSPAEAQVIRGTAGAKSPVPDMAPSLVRLRQECLRLAEKYVGFPEQRTTSSSCSKPPRLLWMIEVGLIPESLIARTLARGLEFPSDLEPLADAVITHIDSHVIGPFFLSKTKNLNRHTERGRLAVGVSCIVVAIVLVVLLAMIPSPLSDQPISRWYRLLLAPLWIAGIGYTLAAWTGVCVWLSLRGKREPDGVEIDHRKTSLRAVLDSGDVEAISTEITEPQMSEEEARKRWVAPELSSLMKRTVPTWLFRERIAESPEETLIQSRSGSHVSKSLSLSSQPAFLVAPFSNATDFDSPANASLPSSPIAAPMPLPLALASPSMKSRKLHILPFEVALIRPAAIASEPALSAAVLHPSSLYDARLARSGTTAASEQRQTSSSPLPRNLWNGVKHATGFAVDTEPVLDENVRREQQKAALKALASCTLMSLVVMIVSVAVP